MEERKEGQKTNRCGVCGREIPKGRLLCDRCKRWLIESELMCSDRKRQAFLSCAVVLDQFDERG